MGTGTEKVRSVFCWLNVCNVSPTSPRRPMVMIAPDILQLPNVDDSSLMQQWTYVNVLLQRTESSTVYINLTTQPYRGASHPYMPKSTLLSFCRTDGTSSTWPKCGRLSDGGTLDHLPSSGEYGVQFLEKLAIHLAELLNYPGVWDAFHASAMEHNLFGRTEGGNVKVKSLPDGYGLFSRSTKGGRQDRYLRGVFCIVWRELNVDS